jgi:hypothetical protein
MNEPVRRAPAPQAHGLANSRWAPETVKQAVKKAGAGLATSRK